MYMTANARLQSGLSRRLADKCGARRSFQRQSLITRYWYVLFVLMFVRLPRWTVGHSLPLQRDAQRHA